MLLMHLAVRTGLIESLSMGLPLSFLACIENDPTGGRVAATIGRTMSITSPALRVYLYGILNPDSDVVAKQHIFSALG